MMSYDRITQAVLRRPVELGQYTSLAFGRRCREAGVRPSMGRVGDAYDNAMCESFFATLKVELVHNAAWTTRAAACTELFEYLELFYNGQRRHSALGYLSPRAFERQLDHEASAA